MELSIVIVSWNTRQLLDNCLRSIYEKKDSPELEIIIVDNASADGTTQMIEKKYPQVKMIKNTKNIGFAAANNQALRQAKGKHILFLNPDTVLLNDALKKATRTLELNPQIGILGAATFDKNLKEQQTVRTDPTFLTQLLLPTKMKRIFPNWKALKKYYCDDFNYKNNSFVKQLQGSFLLVKRELLNKIGSFDEKFFIWFEEVDLCLRTRQAGYKLLYFPEIQIIHYGGESFSQINTIKKQEFYSRSLLHYFYKNKPKWQWLLLYIFKLPILLLSRILK